MHRYDRVCVAGIFYVCGIVVKRRGASPGHDGEESSASDSQIVDWCKRNGASNCALPVINPSAHVSMSRLGYCFGREVKAASARLGTYGTNQAGVT
jgi:hypothetical protein